MTTKIVIAGATGRMGHAVMQGVFDDASLQLYGALDRVGSPSIGRDAGEQVGKNTGVYISDDATKRCKMQMCWLILLAPKPALTT